MTLLPVRIQRGDAVRAKLAALGLTTEDVRDAVDWARQGAVSPVLAVAEPDTAHGASRPKPSALSSRKPKRKD
ncbi:hypothetical protein [Variovorax sp. PBL-E5]|uniref:hypothetical protein n=1 Tax=Variovorax sp. PBL-E5 TaxID=434014 RepID=UPI0018D7B306|nr:hypothetical protein [Variovorax sp. PBL-E5]